MDGFRFKNPEDEFRFTPGPKFWSPDGGRTWIEGDPPVQPVRPDAPKVTVTAVDYERGIIVVE